MIKLKELIKEETIHSCECDGDCCSVNESKGMELGKIFTGHGFAFKNENLEDESCGYTDEIGIDEPELEEAIYWGKLKTFLISVSRSGAKKMDGVKINPQTARAILDYGNSSVSNRKKLEKLPIKKIINLSMKESVDESLYNVSQDMKDGKFDPKNPQVVIQGYGVTNLKTLQDSLSRKFIDLAKKAKKGDVDNLEYLLKKNGVLMGFVDALVDANKQLNSSQMKRKITLYKRKR